MFEVTVWYKVGKVTIKRKLINVIASDHAEASRKAREFYAGYKITGLAPERQDDIAYVDDYTDEANQR